MTQTSQTASTVARRQGFGRREDGSMTVFALFVFVAMLLVAGIAVDTMRVEHERVRMQGATDRAVLAATMLRENISGATPEQIAEAYMTAEGLAAQLDGRVDVQPFDGGRQVTLTPAASMSTGFMRLVGVDSLPVVTRAQAVEAVGQTRFEVVLVLDVTGSMGTMTSNGLTRIENLRTAAADLVEQLLRDTEPGEVALTIVPYAEHVLPPAGFMNSFSNVGNGAGACPDFINWASVRNSRAAQMIRRNCATQDWRTVRPFQHDADAAIAVINGLQASGTTSIDLGVRFGAMFFDSTINPAVEELVSNGTVHSAFANYPLDWNEPGVVRALIMMTDGENCCGGRFSVAVQDQQTRDTCAALRDDRVTIYTVAFEAPQAGVDLMQACATSANHFFNTSGAGIADAFAAVATHIQTQALRLTQ
jgi:Flp pilus assembly protein TadG